MDKEASDVQRDRIRLTQATAATQALESFDLDWLYITPPSVLTAASGIENIFEAEGAVVGAHWDGVVNLMKAGGGTGYSAVVELYERLHSAVEAAASSREAAATRHAEVQDVKQAVELTARDQDSTLRSDIGWPSPKLFEPNGRLRWRWEAVEADDLGPDRYRLVLIPASFNREFQPPDDLTVFSADVIWKEVLVRLREEYYETHAGRAYAEVDRLLLFRRDVVEAVLRTFESTGDVDVYRTYLQGGRAPSEKDLRIACVANAELEAGLSLSSKSQVVRHVHQLLLERGDSASEKMVRKALVRVGAYRQVERGDGRDHNKGGQTPLGIKADLAFLRARLQEICRNRMKEG